MRSDREAVWKAPGVLNLHQYVPDLKKSGLLIVAVSFAVLIAVNIATLVPGPENVLAQLNSNPLAPILSIIVFDTPWTLTGFVGLVLLFGAVLFGSPVAHRRNLSVFFVCASFLAGTLAGVLWDAYYDTTGFVGAGSSAIAIAGQGVVFTLAFFGILRLARQNTRRLGRMSSYWWYSFMVIYATLILTTIWFVGFLQSIFVPTELYNWRVHEFAFFLAVAGTVLYEGAVWRSQGLDGSLATDEMLANYHFDDLNDRFQGRLPKLRVSFRDLPDEEPGGFDPVSSSVFVSSRFRDKDYREVGKEFDGALLHGMVHAELYLKGAPWDHDSPEAKLSFNAEAAEAGATPVP